MNILSIFVTLAVLNLLTSRLVRLLQSANIADMLVTFDVLRYEMPVMVVRFSIPWNHCWHDVGLALAKEELNTTLVILLLSKSHFGEYVPVFRS